MSDKSIPVSWISPEELYQIPYFGGMKSVLRTVGVRVRNACPQEENSFEYRFTIGDQQHLIRCGYGVREGEIVSGFFFDIESKNSMEGLIALFEQMKAEQIAAAKLPEKNEINIPQDENYRLLAEIAKDLKAKFTPGTKLRNLEQTILEARPEDAEHFFHTLTDETTGEEVKLECRFGYRKGATRAAALYVNATEEAVAAIRKIVLKEKQASFSAPYSWMTGMAFCHYCGFKYKDADFDRVWKRVTDSLPREHGKYTYSQNGADVEIAFGYKQNQSSKETFYVNPAAAEAWFIREVNKEKGIDTPESSDLAPEGWKPFGELEMALPAGPAYREGRSYIRDIGNNDCPSGTPKDIVRTRRLENPSRTDEQGNPLTATLHLRRGESDQLQYHAPSLDLPTLQQLVRDHKSNLVRARSSKKD